MKSLSLLVDLTLNEIHLPILLCGICVILLLLPIYVHNAVYIYVYIHIHTYM